MNKIYHVFVSSTYSDLKDERKRVSESIAKAGYVPEGMELFPASSQKQFEFIKRVIDRCDYYVLIIGGRYGSLADNNISYTEMEYEYALGKSISILSFLHANPDKIEFGKTEKTAEYAERLRQFRARVSNGTLVDFWENPDELSAKVVVALSQEATLNPGTGWVRGDQSIDPTIINELESLRKENSSLRSPQPLSTFEFPSWVPDISANVEIKFTSGRNVVTKLANFNEIFLSIYSYLLSEPKLSLFKNSGLFLLLTDKDRDTLATVPPSPIIINISNDEILSLLEAYGLATTYSRVSGQNNATSIRLGLTDKGRKYESYLRYKVQQNLAAVRSL